MKAAIIAGCVVLSVLSAPAAHARGDLCAVVLEPPANIKKDKEYKEDAWLVIRDGPGTQFLRMGKLGTGDFLWTESNCDVHSCDDSGWTHIVGIPKFDGPVDPDKRSYSKGWVRNKYIQEFACPEDQAQTPASLPPPKIPTIGDPDPK